MVVSLYFNCLPVYEYFIVLQKRDQEISGQYPNLYGSLASHNTVKNVRMACVLILKPI